MKNKKIYIIAEAGVNHNGKLKVAAKMIKQAKKIGADAVKFQLFNTNKLLVHNTPLANYQKKNNLKNQNQLLKKLEINEKGMKKLIKLSRKLKIDFLASCFDTDGIKFLKKNNIKIFKVPSGEITNFKYLEMVSKNAKKILLSTGASTINEIKNAMRILKKYIKKKDIVVMHCNSAYPTPLRDINLNSIPFISKKLKCNVGFSDHSSIIETSIFAVAMGADVIEKHFTLNTNFSGPDHKASINPKDFKKMIDSIRIFEKSRGRFLKKITSSEKRNRKIIRKSIVAKHFIKKGEIFNDYNIVSKRPGFGISPMNWKKIIGKRAQKNFYPDQFITIKNL